ncbi:MAG: aspartate kinase [Paludibacteraceae bacterium]|nr:aspartate kinase [Paludibacteraceae bacterium]
MKVLKFGGTSVGSAARMKHVGALLMSQPQPVVVVLSAMSGTTNSLLETAGFLREGNAAKAVAVVDTLECKYRKETEALLEKTENRHSLWEALGGMLSELRSLTLQPWTPLLEKRMVAFGELLSSRMMTALLTEQGADVTLMPALAYMRLNADSEPDLPLTTSLLTEQMHSVGPHHIVITQGFICLNAAGEIDNLKRGGSDYSASVIGACLEAEEIQIWTDIDGMHNNDPRFVPDTQPVPQLSFGEAAELAYFGAKILHPTCILPAKTKNIPVRLLNTLDPEAHGTLISNDYKKGRIEAVAAKDGIAAVRIQSDRMLMAYGFLSRVFAVFEKYRTPIDLITTSEVAVSMSVDNLGSIGAIVEELRTLGTVSFETGLSIISVVGDLRSDNLGFEGVVVGALRDIPVRMISYGGSDHNISLLVRTEDKVRALRALSKAIF